ncbi:MAG TPA: EAL domain-containing protein [Solirubrobacterales bacterium]|nr:EAL domain-containing protein [Solirubrobacterales bacterium]
MPENEDSRDARELRQQWEKCFEHTRRGISITDPATGILTSVNPAFARMHGGVPPDFIGKPLASVFTPESATRIPKLTEEAHHTGYIAYESDHVRNDGSVFPVATEVMAARDDDGKLVYRLSWYDDLTETRRAEERRAAAEAELSLQAEITRNMAEGVVLVRTSDWKIVYVNRTFEGMFGYEPGELNGLPVDVVNAPTDREPLQVAAEIQVALARSGSWSGRVKNLRKDGSTFWCAANITNFEHSEHGEVSVAVHTDITERISVEDALTRSESALQEAQAIAHIGSWEWDIPGDQITWSDELCRIFGVPEGVVPDSYEAYLECVHPEDRELVNDTVQGAYGNLAPYHFVHRVKWPDGTVRIVDSLGRVIADENGNPVRMLGTAQDVTELKLVEDARLEAEERFRRAFDDSAIGMALVSVEGESAGRIIDANDAICTITGHPREALMCTSFESLIHPDDLSEVTEGLRAVSAGHLATLQLEHRILAGAGDEQWVALSTSLVRGSDAQPLHRLVQVQDISERKRFEGQLRYMADHDSLTGLYNRRRFSQELERELTSARRYGTGGALLVIDLDNFKYMNDSAGHAAGDELIRAVANVLKAKLRATDYLARLGGDEFAVLLPHSSPEEAAQAAKAILDVIRDVSLTTEHGPRRTSASIGVAPFRDLSQGAGAEELLIEADIAMYDAKDAGRDRFVVFEPDRERQDALEQRLTWSNRIRKALDEERFVLHAQPICSLDPSSSEKRIELLLRMVDEGGDLIPPATFLYVAERFGMVEEIDRWVVRKAIELVAVEDQEVTVDVNLSAKSIGSDEMVELIGAELERTGADPSRLVFEVTETAAIEQIDRAKKFARDLRSLGCGLAIDDFGSGFATFYYLKHLEFDFVKIDGEFISNLPSSSTDQLVVRSLVQIAKGMGKRTIAEFVQDDATVDLLTRLGVDYAQGFHLGRPGPIDFSNANGAPAQISSVVPVRP